MSFPLSGCSLEMYSSPQSLVSLGCFHTVDGRCIFDCPSVAREGLRLSSVSMAAPAMTNGPMDSDISASFWQVMLQQAAKLCFHPCEALQGEFGAFIVLHMSCSLVELIYKGSAIGGLFSRTRFALFQRLFSSQIRSKIRHTLEKKKHHLFPSGRRGALTILCHIRKP